METYETLRGLREDRDLTQPFKTDSETSDFLKLFAHQCGKTQPQLINEICLDFKETAIEYLKQINTNKTE